MVCLSPLPEDSKGNSLKYKLHLPSVRILPGPLSTGPEPTAPHVSPILSPVSLTPFLLATLGLFILANTFALLLHDLWGSRFTAFCWKKPFLTTWEPRSSAAERVQTPPHHGYIISHCGNCTEPPLALLLSQASLPIPHFNSLFSGSMQCNINGQQAYPYILSFNTAQISETCLYIMIIIKWIILNNSVNE